MSECKLSYDNSKYSKDINKEELDKYTDVEYDSYANKMDIILLHTVSEQRCKPIGCRLQGCLSKLKDPSKCNKLFRELNICIDIERKKLIYDYIKTGQQSKC
jgi:hypothetical protein